ncbi:MAG: hypothetical protein ACOYW7_06715 [Nitrospirota bacterium]
MSTTFKICIAGLIALFLLPLSSAYAESDIKEGYDENTEITIRGKITEIIQERRGPVIVRLKSGNKTYAVVTAPSWHLESERVTFTPGSEIEVRGSKYFGRDGALYIIARHLNDLATGRVITLRDSSCKPMWMHRGHARHRL